MNALQRDFGAARRAAHRHQLEQTRTCIRTRAISGWWSAPPRTATRSRTWWTRASGSRGRTGATCTFHVFVLDRDRRLRYQGRFDDARLPERVTSHDLRNAIEDVLDNRDVRLADDAPIRMQPRLRLRSTPWPRSKARRRPANVRCAAHDARDLDVPILVAGCWAILVVAEADRRLGRAPSPRADRGRRAPHCAPSRSSSSAGS